MYRGAWDWRYALLISKTYGVARDGGCVCGYMGGCDAMEEQRESRERRKKKKWSR